MNFDMKAITNMQRNMQEQMSRMQEQIAKVTAEGSAGGGMVKVTVNGHFEVLDVSIEPEIIDPDDPEMFEDLVMAAMNAAIEKVKQETQALQSKSMSGMIPPGMESLLGGLGGIS